MSAIVVDPTLDTVYAQDTRAPPSSLAELPCRTDVLIVGGGLTGLSAAYHLMESGLKVTLCDAGAIGDGASGRNGGQLHTGQRRDQVWLEAMFGPKMADALWRLGEEAIDLVHRLRRTLRADCDFTPGLIEAAHTASAMDELRAYADLLNTRYGVEHKLFNRDELAKAIGSSRYRGGARDPGGGHLNPLSLVTALANAVHVAGGHLIARARVVGVVRRQSGYDVSVSAGQGGQHLVNAKNVILSGNGMMGGLSPWLDSRIMPLRNYIVATVPLKQPLIPGREAVADTRFVVRYFRQDRKGRMVFGGGETFGRPPQDVARFVRPYLAEIYPQLRNTPLDAAWGGTLGITMQRLPIIRRLEPGPYVGAGFSGQGVGLATFAGKVIADAIAGEASRLDVFGRLPSPPFPGGPALRAPTVHL
ncbi:MAG: FAD-binding oxidoreductase, partial [Pseudomonadota bacterium]